MFEFNELKNKAKVYYVPLHDTNSLTTMIMYPVGSRYETGKMAGVSHFIEHLMFKGTKKRKNTSILTREIDRLGAEYNAFTSKEYTGYYIKTDASYTKIALDILSDMLFNSLFVAKEMEREKTVIVEEIKMYNDNPLMNIDTVFERLFYKGNLGRDIAGSAETVLSLKRDDVLKFRDKFYAPKNMIIVVAGKIDENTKKNVEKFFGEENERPMAKNVFEKFVFGPSSKANRLFVEEKTTDQAQLMLGFPSFNHNDPKNNQLLLLNSILGGSMSSRLFLKIRERQGLAYMVRSGQEKFIDTGYSFVRAGLDAKNINKALKIIKEEIGKICEKGVSTRELKDAKTHIKGALALSMEDSSSVAGWYAKQAMFMDKIKSPDEKMTELQNITEADIKKIANEVFKMNEMRIAVIGNVAKDKIKF